MWEGGRVLRQWEEHFKELLRIEKEKERREINENDQGGTRIERREIEDEGIGRPNCEK
jgi:hypothetical protein